jgi:mannosyltransferase
VRGGTLTGSGLAIVACTAVAALLRFPTLDAKSFWVDEVVTVSLVRRDFGSMLSAIPDSESTPPAYYVLAWLWAQVFGIGEAGLRSLSALLGTALVPVAYLAGRRLVSPHVGVAAAALVAVNPLLVWYSQEARAYMLLALLGGVSLLLFLRCLDRPTAGALAAWAAVGALAFATHYFAVFLVAPEAAWLLYEHRRRGAVWLATGGIAACGLALLPLALDQLENPRWIAESGFAGRLAQIPAIFLVGFEVSLPLAFAVAAVAAVAAGVGFWLLLRRTDDGDRRRGLLAAGVGAAVVAIPAALALVGLDYIVYKNVIVAVFPLALALSVGFTARRAGALGLGALAVLVALSVAIAVGTLREPKYHREDWRRAAEAIGAAAGPRALVVTPLDGALPLELYLGATRRLGSGGDVVVQEIDLVAGARRPLGSIADPTTPRPPTPAPPDPAFAPVERREADHFTLIRYRSDEPRRVSLAQLRALALDAGRNAVLTQLATGRSG